MHLLRVLIMLRFLPKMHTRQEHGHTIRETDATPAEGVDRVNILAEDACCKTVL